MATAKKAAAKKVSKPRSTAKKALDAIKVLTQDHREVKLLFQEYEELVEQEADAEERQSLALHICALLSVHAQIEEEIFYPVVKAAIKETDLIHEATVEHASAKDLIAQIESAETPDELFDAKVKVLGEYVEHHVKEEESEMFPKARRAKIDLVDMVDQLQTRKGELLTEMGIEDLDLEQAT